MDPELQDMAKDLGVQKFREAVVNTSNYNEDIQAAMAPDIANVNVDIEQWQQNMASDRYWVDHAFIQLCANYIKRDIMILPFYKEDGHKGTGWIKIPAKESAGKIYLLCYMNIHYQSIVSNTKSIFGQAIQEATQNPTKKPRRQ